MNDIWSQYAFFIIPCFLLWIVSSIGLYINKLKKISIVLICTGIFILGSFICILWYNIERLPLKTMGETRLIYSFFLMIISLITYIRWRYKWLIVFSTIMSIIFLSINIFKPEIQSKNLMPALQSSWFFPHVTLYLLSYAILATATLSSINQLYILKTKKKIDEKLMLFIDNIIYIGFSYLVIAMLLGAVWAKQAWGHYWSWDPKETWAFITACSYLIYIHLRLRKEHLRKSLIYIPISFILLMIAWKGVEYLPISKYSVHTYSNE